VGYLIAVEVFFGEMGEREGEKEIRPCWSEVSPVGFSREGRFFFLWTFLGLFFFPLLLLLLQLYFCPLVSNCSVALAFLTGSALLRNSNKY